MITEIYGSLGGFVFSILVMFAMGIAWMILFPIFSFIISIMEKFAWVFILSVIGGAIFLFIKNNHFFGL